MARPATCLSCQETIHGDDTQLTETPCGHQVCTKCLRQRINEDETAVTCPVCRQTIPLHDSEDEGSDRENALRAPSPNGSASASVAPTPSVAIRPLSKTTPAGERRAWPEDQALKTAIVQALRPSQRDWGVLDVEGIRASDLALAPEDVMQGSVTAEGKASQIAVAKLRVGSLMHPVVVKRLHVPKGASGPLIDHLAEIVRASWRCSALCRIYGYVVDSEGKLCIVMDRINDSLQSTLLLAEGDDIVDVPEALGIAAAVLRALAQLHEGGVAHLDVRPSNVLLAPDGRAVLADNGLAAALASLGYGTFPWGNPAYQPPECMTEGGAPSTASDMWSFGCLVVALFTSKDPFPGFSPAQIVHAVGGRSEKPDVPRSVPEELRKQVARCFARQPGARPLAKDLLRDFARYLSPLPGSDDSPSHGPAPPAVDSVMAALLALGFRRDEVVHAVRKRLCQALPVDGRAVAFDLLHSREVQSGSLADVEAALATEGVTEVDLCWSTVRLGARDTLKLSKPGVLLKNGKIIGAGAAHAGPLIDIHADGCRLEKVTVEGGGPRAPAVAVCKARGTVLKDWVVTECQGMALSGTGDVTMIDLVKTEVAGAKGPGAVVRSGADLRATHCVISDCQGGALVGEGLGTTIQVEGGRYSGNGAGVALRSQAYAQVASSTFVGNAGPAVHARDRGTRADVDGVRLVRSPTSLWDENLVILAEGHAVVQVGRRTDIVGRCRGRRGGRVVLPFSFAGLLRHIAVCLLYVLLAALAYDVLHAAGVVKPEVHAAVLESLSVGRDWAAKGWAETSRGAWSLAAPVDAWAKGRLSRAVSAVSGPIAVAGRHVAAAATSAWSQRRLATGPLAQLVVWLGNRSSQAIHAWVHGPGGAPAPR